ncbi:endoribonuclease Dicer [Biomphalaria glabrata]
MLAKELSSVTRLSLGAGGKRTFFLTDSEEDVDLLCQTLPNHTDLFINSCPMVLETEVEKSFNDWRSLMQSNNILVCLGTNFLYAIQRNYIQLKEVNLIIFDNCHNAVEVENHPYAAIVQGIKKLTKSDRPHILGVTAAIAGTDCNDPEKLTRTISSMEETMFAYAETSMLILSERFGCRPKESIIRCGDSELYDDHSSLKDLLEDILEQCYFFFSDCRISIDDAVDNRNPCDTPLQVLNQCLNILNILGSWCTASVAEYFIMQLDKIIKFEKNDIHKQFLRCVITTLRYLVKTFEMNFHPNYDVNELLEYTTPKVRELVTVLRKYKPEMDFIIVSNSDSYNDDDEFSDISDDDDDSIMSGSDDEDSSGEGTKSKPMHIAVKRTADGGHERIMTFSEEEEKNLCGIVFVESRYIAFGLNKIIEEVCSWDENLCFVKSCHITGQGLRGANGKQKVNKTYKRQEEALRKFRTQECNLVIATLELEEGIDIPKCNLVVRFDPPKDFRAYALSKGRARARDAVYVILLDNDNFEGFNSSLKVFKGIEQVLLGENRCLSLTESLSSGEEADCEAEDDEEEMSESKDQQLTPYYTMPNTPNSPHVTMQSSIALINRYCAKLPSDAFTHLTPHCRIESVAGEPPLYIAYLRLPINSPIKEELQGPAMKTRKLAKMAVALKMCEILHKKGELDENLVPVGKEMFLYEEEEECQNEEDMTGQARPGTTKRKQFYIKKTAEVLLNCRPLPGEPSFLYLINLKLTGPITDEQNTRGRVIYAPEDTVQTLGILLSKKIPLMPYFPVYTRSGEVTVSIDLIQDIICSEEEILRLSKFHHFVFSGVLHLEKDPMDFDYVKADCGYLVVPLNGKSHNELEIEWDFVDKVIDFIKIEKRAGFSSKGGSEPFHFNVDDFEDAVVMPSYRNIDQPQHFYVAEIRHDLNPVSPFPSPELYKTFQDYYTTKYGLMITNTVQPLLDVDHTSARLNLLTPRYMNQKGVALPTSSAETKRARRENLQQKQILVPELCDVHVFPASLWRKTVCLPAILYRANYLLLAEELRQKISRETGIGLEGLPERFRFPKLDFGFDTSPEKLLDNEGFSKKNSPNSKISKVEEANVRLGHPRLKLENCELQTENFKDHQIQPDEIAFTSEDTKTESSSDSDSGVASSSSSSDNCASKFYKCEAQTNLSLEQKSVDKNSSSPSVESSITNYASDDITTSTTNSVSCNNQNSTFTKDGCDLPFTPALQQSKSNFSTPAMSVISLSNHAPVTKCTSTISLATSLSPSVSPTFNVDILKTNESTTYLSKDTKSCEMNQISLVADTSTPGAYCQTGANINATLFLPCSTITTPPLFMSSSSVLSSSSLSSFCNIKDPSLVEEFSCSPMSTKLVAGKMNPSDPSSSVSPNINAVLNVKNHLSNSKADLNIPGCEPQVPDAADPALFPATECIHDTLTTSLSNHCASQSPVAQSFNHNHISPSNKAIRQEHDSAHTKNGYLLNGHAKHGNDSELSDGPLIIMNTLSEELSGLDIDLIIPQTNTSDTFHTFDTPLQSDTKTNSQCGKKYGPSSWQQAWLNEMEADLLEEENPTDEKCVWNSEEKALTDKEKNSKNVPEESLLADNEVIKFSFDTQEVKTTQDNSSSQDKNELEKGNSVQVHTKSEEAPTNITDFEIDYWNTADKNTKKSGENSLTKMYNKLIDQDEGIYDELPSRPLYSKLKELKELSASPQQADAVATVSLDEDRDLTTFVGPSPCLIMQALTMSNANDFFSLERLETIGDSFLKYAITVYLYCSYPGIHEGKLSYLRSKQVSNYNLYRLGRRKGLAECMVSTKFEPFENWLPPGYVINDDKRRGPVPKVVIVTPGSKVNNSLRNFYLDEADTAKKDEAVLFNKELEWIQQSQEADQQDEVQQEPSNNLTPYSLQCHHGLPDKSVADSVEALIGCYLTTCGRTAALIFMSWLGLRVLPKKKKTIEDSNKLERASGSSFCKLAELEFDELRCPPSPMFSNTEENQAKLQHLLQGFDSLEEKIGYTFRDKSYLLQAFTHASYHYNTITDCYQRVEFLGDAILDYVITRHLYEDSQKYSPGILTDLRSALVNNNIFAALAVKWGFHKYFKAISPSLFQVIDKFVKCQKEKKDDDIDIDEEFRELSLEDCEQEEGADEEDEDEEVEMEIPKALGDIFESVAGAIYLDSGMSLDTVWRVYYRMMKPHIDKYLKSIPKSPVRELLETEPETAKFERPERTMNGKVRVTVNVVGVYGYNPRCRTKGLLDSQSKDNLYTSEVLKNRLKYANVVQLIDSYRNYGHLKAKLDPLKLKEEKCLPELDLRLYGIDGTDKTVIPTLGLLHGNSTQIALSELVQTLERLYCSSIAAEFQHLQTLEEREWFADKFETRHEIEVSDTRKVELAKLMLRCEAFDHFVGTKFSNVKRYGGEGGESMMVCFEELFHKCALNDVKDVVICMPHRGRLNFMTCLLNFPPVIVFRKMKGLSEIPVGAKSVGDVLSHLYTSVDLPYAGKQVHVSLIPNPSHLEANNPVAVGKARSKLQTRSSGDYSVDSESQPKNDVLCLQVHGDASFAGQGIVAETFCFANAPHFETGGSVHLIVNNQVGFTTESERGRSSQYCSDIAKVNGYPVIHVNGDYPEDVLRATSLAFDYRQKFHKDVIIDYICFRKWGHNEMDEPSFTQPRMYQVINNRQSIPDLYSKSLIQAGLCEDKHLQENVTSWTSQLNNNLEQVSSHEVKPFHLQGLWSSFVQAGDQITTWDTGVPADILKYVGARSVTVPQDLKVHPTIKKTHIERRINRLTEGTHLDWATGEALAFGSLLHQGYNVRISGQDVGRGTFSHRHCMIVDQETDHIYIPLNKLSETQTGFLEVANSVLSEEAVLGFEYGMSIDHPNTLVIWEAQFGDFFNGAQPIIDTYVTCGELKWLLQSGIVMLLPHGMDGAGPEHSSCRIERFLQQCDSKEDGVDGDDVNIQIVNPTTPAQYFHLLRRQMVRNFRKPLIVAAPKMILRSPAAVSSLADMESGTHFHPVLADPDVTPADVTRVVFCSGKHYYSLVAERETRAARHVALVRLESLCPFPTNELQEVLKKYPKAKQFIWSQEEHRNMGAWTFVQPRFQNLVGCNLKYAGRKVLGIPAVGIGELHKAEVTDVLNQTFV